jgi:hypothetical protein
MAVDVPLVEAGDFAGVRHELREQLWVAQGCKTGNSGATLAHAICARMVLKRNAVGVNQPWGAARMRA